MADWTESLPMLDAQRGAGALLAKMAKNPGGRPPKNNRFHDGTSLRDAGYTKKDSHRWQLAALVPEKEYRDWTDKTRKAHKQLTTSELRNIEQITLMQDRPLLDFHKAWLDELFQGATQ